MEAVGFALVGVEVADAFFRPLPATFDIRRRLKAFWFLASEAVEVVPLEVGGVQGDLHGYFGWTEGVVIEGVTCDLASTLNGRLVESRGEPASEAARGGFEAA